MSEGLVSHEKRCNGMITLSYVKSNKKLPEKVHQKTSTSYTYIKDRVLRDKPKPKGLYTIDYTYGGKRYSKDDFMVLAKITDGYLLHLTARYKSCTIDDVICTFERIPRKKKLYKLTMTTGEVYDRVTAYWIADKIGVSRQHIYSCDTVRGHIIEKIKE